MIGLHNVYPVDESIATFDLDTDVEEYNYDGRTVYRGNVDPDYSGVQVHWLYNDENKRVGLAEHTSDGGHKCLWYRDNVFSTLLQEDWSVYDETVWNIMTETAYNDCMKRGWTTVNELKTRTRALKLITPGDIAHCGKKQHPKVCDRCLSTLILHQGCVVIDADAERKKLTLFDTLFVDDDGTIYIPPGDSVVYRCDDGDYATFLRRGATAAAGAGAGAGAGGSIAAAPPP